jgi:hypothetical protein
MKEAIEQFRRRCSTHRRPKLTAGTAPPEANSEFGSACRPTGPAALVADMTAGKAVSRRQT